MIYFAVFIIILVVIITITYVARRVTRAQAMRRNPIPQPPPPQRFREVAREVTGRFYRSDDQRTEPYNPYARRDLGSTYNTGMRSTGGNAMASQPPISRPQERDVEAGDPELPTYYADSSLPVLPPAVFESSILGRNRAANQSSNSLAPPMADGSEPPKYEA